MLLPPDLPTWTIERNNAPFCRTLNFPSRDPRGEKRVIENRMEKESGIIIASPRGENSRSDSARESIYLRGQVYFPERKCEVKRSKPFHNRILLRMKGSTGTRGGFLSSANIPSQRDLCVSHVCPCFSYLCLRLCPVSRRKGKIY